MATAVDLVVRGGLVINESWRGAATVLVGDGKILAVQDASQPLPVRAAGASEVDATGRWVLPGGVDPHCHVGIDFGGYATQDDYSSCTLAALHGGTTTIVDFAIPVGGQTPLDAVVERRDMATKALTDTALHGCIVSWDDETADVIRQMAHDGITTIKMFTTYRDLVMANADTIRRVLTALGEIGGLAYVHAESNHLVEACQERLFDAGHIDVSYHPQARPPLTEVDAVATVLKIAELTGAPVYFVHQSTPEVVDLVHEARSRGVRAFAETCPHYALLDEDLYRGEGGEGFVCCPPIRARALVDGLMERIVAGAVDTIGSDHCCYTMEQKRAGRHDLRAMPYGLPGVETRAPLLFSELISKRGVPPERFVALLAATPAKLNGLYPQKGVIAPGADADLVVWDPHARWRIRTTDLHMETDYTPYEGWEVTGRPDVVISGGEIVVEKGMTVATRQGRLLHAGPIDM